MIQYALIYTPGGIRTHYLRLRRPTLYPDELLARLNILDLESFPAYLLYTKIIIIFYIQVKKC